MNETQYDRAWQHFNVPKLEIQNTTLDEEKTHWLEYKIKYTQQTHICVIKCSPKRDSFLSISRKNVSLWAQRQTLAIHAPNAMTFRLEFWEMCTKTKKKTA